MEIEFYKTKDHRVILTLKRKDGSSSWSKLHPGLQDHDMAHYAVESTLNLKNAFFGLIEQGADIPDFEDKEKAPYMGPESLQTEHLVNLLQTEMQNVTVHLDILKMLYEVLEQSGLPPLIDLNEDNLEVIRSIYREESKKLRMLHPGEKIHYSIDV